MLLLGIIEGLCGPPSTAVTTNPPTHPLNDGWGMDRKPGITFLVAKLEWHSIKWNQLCSDLIQSFLLPLSCLPGRQSVVVLPLFKEDYPQFANYCNQFLCFQFINDIPTGPLGLRFGGKFIIRPFRNGFPLNSKSHHKVWLDIIVSAILRTSEYFSLFGRIVIRDGQRQW